MFESGQEALTVFGMPFQMCGSGQEAHPNVRECLGCPHGWLRGPPGCLGVVKRPFRMSASGWEALPNDRECSGGLTGGREWSGGPPLCPREVGGPHWWSGGLPKCLGVAGWPSRMFKSGWEALPDIREWSGVPHGWSG